MTWSKLPLWILGATLLIASGGARAAVILDTLPGNSGSRTLTSTSTISAESVTGTISIGDIALDLKVAGTNGSLVITLWGDSGTAGTGAHSPGTKLATLATISELAIKNAIGATNTEGLINISNINFLSGATGLTSADTYWIEVGISGSPLSNLTTYSGPTNSLSSVTSYFTTALQTSPPWMQMCVSGDNSCISEVTNTDGMTIAGNFQAPEPASLAILGSAMTGLGLIRRRRAKRAAAKS